MAIRQEIQRFGHALYCRRSLAHAQITPVAVMQQAVQALPTTERRAFMQWLTQFGPYWEDGQLHLADDWIEAAGEIVTDTAVGEAAISRLSGLDRELVSFAPSAWEFTPIQATWTRNDGHLEDVLIPNHWEIATIAANFEANPEVVLSWSKLGEHLKQKCAQLFFAEDAFEPLEGHPFVPGAAERICVLLTVLNKFRNCFDNQGNRNEEGHEIYANHFAREKGWFSDSSDPEKDCFRHELTFRHPERPGENLFCSWHGKVKTPQIRIHFSWPVQADSPLYVVYIGPKITKA